MNLGSKYSVLIFDFPIADVINKIVMRLEIDVESTDLLPFNYREYGAKSIHFCNLDIGRIRIIRIA